MDHPGTQQRLYHRRSTTFVHLAAEALEALPPEQYDDQLAETAAALKGIRTALTDPDAVEDLGRRLVVRYPMGSPPSRLGSAMIDIGIRIREACPIDAAAVATLKEGVQLAEELTNTKPSR